jgi:hypothetical protein
VAGAEDAAGGEDLDGATGKPDGDGAERIARRRLRREVVLLRHTGNYAREEK